MAAPQAWPTGAGEQIGGETGRRASLRDRRMTDGPILSKLRRRMAHIKVQTEDFDVGAEIAALTAGRTDVGGIACFIGTVRDNSGRAASRLVSMTLEHYPGMTESALVRITEQAAERWPLLGCTVIHRVGALCPGENIVLVIATSAHRQAALDATAFLIDWLKTRAPFWKKEQFEDGAESWVAAREQDDAAAARWEPGSVLLDEDLR